MESMEAGPSTRRLRPIAPMPAPASAVGATSSDRSLRVRLPAVPADSTTAANLGPASSHQNKRASTRNIAKPVDTIPNHADSIVPTVQTAVSASSVPTTYSRRKRSRSLSAAGLPSLLQPLRPDMNGLSEQLITASRESTPLSSASSAPPTSPSTVHRLASSDRKGKAKAPGTTAVPRQPKPAAVRPEKPQAEKRVLPARIRRAAGGGADGIRDLEEMIVDWLERWGEPVESPPDRLALHLTTLPLSLIDPPPNLSGSIPSEPFPPVTTMQKTASGTVQLEPAQPIIEAKERIEVPSWVYVKAGEDDQEEAKDELQTLNWKNGRGSLSPVKRLRHATAEAPMEDTSDAYYIALHKKYEVFERRQRIREKEKLQFERYKLRSRIDLLRGMSKTSWSAVVSVVLSRSVLTAGASGEGGEDRWAKGREKLGREGVDWLRDTLVKEGEELMKRFDQLLPPEHRKARPVDSRTPTPMTSPSLSPPPVIPHRVAALRDPHTLPKKTSPSTTHANLPKRITLTLKAKSASTPTRPQPMSLAPATEPTGRGREKRKRADLGEMDESQQRRSTSRLSTSSGRMRNQSGDAAISDGSPASKERRVSLRSRPGLEKDTTRNAIEPGGRVSRSSARATGIADRTIEAQTTDQPVSQHDSLDTLVSPGGATQHYNAPSDTGSKPEWEEYTMEAELSPEEARELREVEAVVL